MLAQIREYLTSRPIGTEIDSRETGEGLLHTRLRQFVTQQATLIRQGSGAIHSTQQRKNKPQGRGIPGREKTGIVSGDSCQPTGALTASLPMSLREFNQLHIDQKMMLALEKGLQLGSVKIEIAGKKGETNSDSKHSHEFEGEVQSRKKQRLDVEKSEVSEDSTGFKCSLLDPRFHITLLTHSMCQHSQTVFTDHAPTHIIMLDADIKTIRMIEVYQASSMVPVKVDNF